MVDDQKTTARTLYASGARVVVNLVRPVAETLETALRTQPGMSIRRGKRQVHVPVHLGPRVGTILRRAGAGIESIRVAGGHAHKLTARALTLDEATAQIQQSPFAWSHWDAYLTPYQREGALQLVRTGSGNLWWAAGAGKTVTALAWACAGEGAIVVVTKASVRRSFAREIQEHSSLRPYVFEPDGRERADWRSPLDYTIAAWTQGQRPVFVVGWEELPALVYGAAAHQPGEKVTWSGWTAAVPAEVSWERDPFLEALRRIPGVGARAATLIAEAHDLAELRSAAIRDANSATKQLCAIEGVGPGTAAAVVQALQAPMAPPTARERTAHATAICAGFLPALLQITGIPIGSAVFDEIHFAKNPRRKKWVESDDGRLEGTSLHNRVAAAAWLARNSHRRLGMTATPLANTPADFWAQLDLIEPGAWGAGASPFLRWFLNAKPGEYGGLVCAAKMPPAREAEFQFRLGEGSWAGHEPQWRAVHKVTASEARRHLPPMRRRVLYLSPHELVASCNQSRTALRNAHGPQEKHEAALAFAASRKRRVAVSQMVDGIEAGQKVVVFTARHYDVADLIEGARAEMIRRGLVAVDGAVGGPPAGETILPGQIQGQPSPYSLDAIPVWGLHGGHDTALRDACCENYLRRTPRAALLVGTGYALGTGQNLQDTDLALIVMLPWTTMDIEQWEGRFSRHGQHRPVEVRYLIAERTKDEEIAHVLIGKLPAVQASVGIGNLASAQEDLKGLGDRESVMAALLEQRAAAYRRKIREEEDGWWD